MTAARLSAVLLFCLLAPGCHAKFKKNAPLIDEVRVQPLLVGGPSVQLGKMSGSADGRGGLLDVAAVAVNTTQAIKEVNLERRIAEAVVIEDVSANLKTGLEETLGSGPPFGTTDDENHGELLQLEILSYGINVPYLGAPGSFTFSAKARLYRPDGDRVYRNTLSCSGSLGDPAAVAVVFGTVNNAKALKDMSNEEINAAVSGMARYCGQRFATQMRKHAG